MVVVLVPCCLFRPGMDWLGSFFLSLFLFCLEDKDSVLECLGGECLFLKLRDLEADLDLPLLFHEADLDFPLLFLGPGGGDDLLGPGEGVLGGDLGTLVLFLLDAEMGSSSVLSSDSLHETV